MSAIFAVAGKLVTLFIYVLVGYVVSKRKMISEGFCWYQSVLAGGYDPLPYIVDF